MSLTDLLANGTVAELRTAVVTLAATVQASRHVVRHSAKRELSAAQLDLLKGHGADDLIDAVKALMQADQAYCDGITGKRVTADETRVRSACYADATRKFDETDCTLFEIKTEY
jgi:hypothetical protein